MNWLSDRFIKEWGQLSTRYLPFADAATTELPLGRLLRLALLQFTVGMAAVLLIGTLNRVMIVELGVSSWLVAIMVSLPLVFAPFRTLVGFRSDTHRSALGWRRVPYLGMGTMLQFGGLAIMPMALILLSGDSNGPVWVGHASAALAFLLTGAGLHTTQTVGLALATDLAPPHARPRVVALLCVMLLVGMVFSALIFGALLANFSQVRLIQVVQGAALATLVINTFAMWQQEPLNRARASAVLAEPQPSFQEAWHVFASAPQSKRRMLAIGLGTAGFGMQDVLLEPYGGQILHLSVAATTLLTAVLAAGGVAGLWLAARKLAAGGDPYRVAALGAVFGLFAFSAVVFSAPLQSTALFGVGVALIGFGGGLFAHGTMTAFMELASANDAGLALGTWGAVQASAAGLAVALGGIIRDLGTAAATKGWLGPGLEDPVTGYMIVYHLELLLLFASLLALGPLVRSRYAMENETGAGSLAMPGGLTTVDIGR